MRALLGAGVVCCGLSGCFMVLPDDGGHAPAGGPYAGPEPWHVRCESDDGRARHCPMDTSRGVQIERQLSKSSCVEGQGWGYDDRGVWVDHGCRAEFAIASPYGDTSSGDAVVRCESDDGHYRLCRGGLRGGAVLLRQLSNAPCIEDRTWGWKPQGVWVDRGCRADFGSGTEWGDEDTGVGYRGPTRTLRCESDDGRPHRCDLAARGARLQRQISNSRCIQGETWGWDPGGVWVTAGCRGDFAVW